MKVRVRMYRQGLGDCFLLTFEPGGNEKHILIDCGTLGATTTGVSLAKVVADIRTTTGDHLHLVIATHEHWDHVSGFGGQEAAFKQIQVDHVWLAWTEDPDDDLAKAVAEHSKDLGTAVMLASRALTAAGVDKRSKEIGLAVRDLVGFFGDDDALAAGRFAESVNDAMTFVRTELGVTAEFFSPKDPIHPSDAPIEPSWLPGFRFYVLGPPRDEKALNDLGEHGSSDLYGLVAALGAPMKTGGGADRCADEIQRETPFDDRFRHRRDAPGMQALFRDSYFAESEAWRRVDHDWLHVASDMALQLDDATNNTSLVLAIERIADGKVLLLPADAQQGNWLSWHGDKMSWTITESDGTTRKVTATDLLNRTVFYKVGHHSSHNATAKAKGLELMKAEKELTAFIPVDRAVALKRHPAGSWKMPARPLYRRLLEKCQGRVVRSDIGWAVEPAAAKDPAVENEFVGMATAAQWKKWRKAQQAAETAKKVTISDLFIDYTLK